MNLKKRLPSRILRIAALALAISLIFGSMAVFYAESEPVAHDETHQICAVCAKCETAGCDYAEGVCSTGCKLHNEETDICELCGGCKAGDKCYSEAGVECALADCPGDCHQHTDADVCELCNGCTAGDKCYSAEGVECALTDCAGNCHKHEDADVCDICGGCKFDGDCYKDTGLDCELLDCEGNCHKHEDADTCPNCGGCKTTGACYSDKGVECELDVCDGTCHAHNAANCGELCAKCGGCSCDNMDYCYADGEACEPCECITGLSAGKTSGYLYLAEIEDMGNGGSREIDLMDELFFILGNGNGHLSLEEALASDKNSSVTLTAKTDKVLNPKCSPQNREFPSVKGTTIFTVDGYCLQGAKAGDVMDIQINVKVKYNGVDYEANIDYPLNVLGDGSIRKLELVDGTDNFSLEKGAKKTLTYNVVFTDKITDSFKYMLECPDSIKATISRAADKDASTAVLKIDIEALEVGTKNIELYVYDDGKTNPCEFYKVITVKCKEAGTTEGDTDDKEDELKTPPYSASMSAASIKVGEKVTLTAKGGYNGKTLADSTLCYVPISWKVNPSGEWKVPATITESALTQTATVEGLKAGTYTPEITFAEYANIGGTWIPTTNKIVATTTLTVKSSGSSSNSGKGDGPDTSDITVDKNPGRTITAVAMLSVGLLIIFAVASERIFRAKEDRKRRANAIRR